MKPHTWVAIAGIFVCSVCIALSMFQERKATKYILYTGGALVVLGTLPEWSSAIVSQFRSLRDRWRRRQANKKQPLNEIDDEEIEVDLDEDRPIPRRQSYKQEPGDYVNRADAVVEELRSQRRQRRGNLQGCGCLLICAGILCGLTFFLAPIAGLLILVGLIVLIVGLCI